LSVAERERKAKAYYLSVTLITLRHPSRIGILKNLEGN
jgi:hypothetical protein